MAAQRISAAESLSMGSHRCRFAHIPSAHTSALTDCAAVVLSTKGCWPRCDSTAIKYQQQDAKEIVVQVKRKAEAMDGDVKAEFSDGGPPLKQTKSLGALKIKLKMPRPSQQP